MKINTKAFGEIEISEKQKITFKTGLYGFEDILEFAMLDTEQGSPFFWLQSLEYKEIAFIIIDPLMVDQEYVLDVNPEDIKELEVKNDGDTLVFVIVTVFDKPEDITVNLLGPLLINKNTHIAKQVINQKDYSVKHPLITKKGAQC